MAFFMVILQSLNHDNCIHVCRKNYIRLEEKAV
jgi:hypothetical protein